MFENMKLRMEAADCIMRTLKYLKDDTTESLSYCTENETCDINSYKVQLDALEIVEKALYKFVVSEK